MSDASYHAGISAVLTVADEAAAAIRARPDAGGIRQQAAAEALEAFSTAFRCAEPCPSRGTPSLRLYGQFPPSRARKARPRAPSVPAGCDGLGPRMGTSGAPAKRLIACGG